MLNLETWLILSILPLFQLALAMADQPGTLFNLTQRDSLLTSNKVPARSGYTAPHCLRVYPIHLLLQPCLQCIRVQRRLLRTS